MSSAGGNRLARGAFGRTPSRDHVVATRELFAACEPGARSAFLGAMHAMDLRALDALDVPVTVIAGERDRLTHPRYAKEIARRLGAELHVLEGAGHMLPLERPDEVTQLISR
jgi:pimeloyl-ACP methyl ester carboxylesterase